MNQDNYKFRFFGYPQIIKDGENVEIPRKIVLALVAYLAIEQKPHSRDALATLLWPHEDQKTARANLRRIVSSLRSVIPKEYLTANRATVEFHGNASLIDVHRFEMLVSKLATINGNFDEIAQITTLYQADFLAGFSATSSAEFEQWQTVQQERFKVKYIDALHKLSLYAGADAQYDRAIEFARIALQHDETSEQLQHLLIQLYALNGQRTQALKQYHDYVAILQSELGVQPNASTLELYTLIQTNADLPAITIDFLSDVTHNNGQHHTSAENPYQGLSAFQESNHKYFFGREGVISRSVGFLQQGRRLIVVTGPSGSGKSSIVKAGLIPAVRANTPANSIPWRIVEMKPGHTPIKQLAVELSRLTHQTSDTLHQALWQDEHGLTDIVNQLLSGNNTELLLVIDQFEELFTLVDDIAIIEHFLDLLYFAVTDEDSRLRIVATLRADFYHKPLGYRVFGALVGENTLVVEPMTPEELERAIVNPAQLVGVTITPNLSGIIISDVSSRVGALPMLQYALYNLFEERTGNIITLETYQKIGGVFGALTQQLDRIYATLNNTEQKIFRQVMLRLVTIDEEGNVTKRRVLQPDIESIHAHIVPELIDTFTSARVLTVDGNGKSQTVTVELAHEALIIEWRAFNQWIKHYQADIQEHRVLLNATKDWLTANKDSAYLLQDTRLYRFVDWRDSTDFILADEENAFIQASIDFHERQAQTEKARQQREVAVQQRARQRLAYLVGALLLFSVIVSILGIYALDRQNDAIQNENVSKSLAFAANSQQELNSENFDTSLALAIEAVSGETVPAEAELALAEIAYRPITMARFEGHQEHITDIAYSDDGRYLVTASLDHTMRVIDTSSYKTLYVFDAHTAPVYDVEFIPDSDILVSASGDDSVRMWDVSTGEELRNLQGHNSAVTALALHPAGKFMLSASENGTVILWNSATGEEIKRFEGHIFGINTLGFSPDGTLIASGSSEGRIIVWDVETGEQIQSIETRVQPWNAHAPVLDLVFAQLDPENPEAYQVIASLQFGFVIAWDIATGEEFIIIQGKARNIGQLDTDASQSRLLSGDIDGKIVIWDLPGGRELQSFQADAPITALAFDPSGQFVAYSTPDAILYIWDTLDRDLSKFVDYPDKIAGIDDIVVFPSNNHIALADSANGMFILDDELNIISEVSRELGALSVAISADESRVVGGTRDGVLLVLDTESGETQEVTLHDTAIHSLDLSPDGKFIVTGSGGFNVLSDENDIVVWDTENFEEIVRFSDHTATVHGVMFRPGKSSQLVSASEDGTVRIWDIDKAEEVLRMNSGETLTSLDITEDGKIAITGATSGDIILWDLDSGEIVDVLTGHTSSVNDVVLNRDGRLMSSASQNGMILVWDFNSREVIRRYFPGRFPVFVVQFSPDSDFVYSGGGTDLTLYKWQLHTLDELIAWTKSNRYIHEFTCAERDTYNIEPLCEPVALVNQTPSNDDAVIEPDFDMPDAELIFSDDFSTSKAWIDASNGDYVRNEAENYLDWLAKRDTYQLYAMPIPTITTPAKFRFRVQSTNWDNNNTLQVGLAESLVNSYLFDGRLTGVFVDVGWFGGGTEFENQFIAAFGQFQNYGRWSSAVWNIPSTYVAYENDHWYWIEITIIDKDWRIQVFEADGVTLRGELVGQLPETHDHYRYFVIVSQDQTDWPTGSGMLDDIEVYAQKSN